MSIEYLDGQLLGLKESRSVDSERLFTEGMFNDE